MRCKGLEVEVYHKALDEAPEKNPRILKCIKVEHVESEALAGLEVEAVSKDGPCVDEVGASRPNGLSKKLEIFVPRDGVLKSSNVDMVSAVPDHSEDVTI